MKIIELDSGKRRREIVAGLVWHPLHESGASPAKEILAYAKDSESDLKVTRTGDRVHIGFAKKSEGAKAGQISAAAVIADALIEEGKGSNALVAIQLPGEGNSYLFLAIRETIILADGDAIGSRDEIRVRLVGDVSYDGWDIVICPDEWGVPDSVEKGFDDFFNETSLKSAKRWMLTDVSIAWRKYVVPTLLIVALGVGGSFGWSYWSKKKALEAEIQRQRQAEADLGKRAAPAAPPKPWPLLPTPISFATACEKALQSTGLVAGNWLLDKADCDGGRLVVRWTKPNESAWISHLYATRPNVVMSSDGMSASLAQQATATASERFDEVLPSAEDATLRLYDLASRYGLSVRVAGAQSAAAPVALPGQTPAQVPVVAPTWTELTFFIATVIEPNELASVLSAPGLRFQRISYSLKSGFLQYQITGVQYARP